MSIPQAGTAKPEEMLVDTPQIEAASTMKLSSFWSANPQIWFDTAELQFRLCNVSSDKNKFLHVLTALPPEVSDKISDLIRDPPADNMFATIKHTILERMTPSNEAQLDTLLSGLDIGDGRPSDLLRRIRALAKEQFGNNIIRTLWIRRLPEVLRLTLVAQPDTTPLDELANTADRIYEAMNRSSRIASINVTNVPSSSASRPPLNTTRRPKNNDRVSQQNVAPAPTLSNIISRLDALERRLNNLRTINRSRSRNQNNFYTQRSRSFSGNRNIDNRNSNTTRTPNASNTFNNAWCYLHNRYGTRAHNCKSPCSFQRDNQVNSVAAPLKNE